MFKVFRSTILTIVIRLLVLICFSCLLGAPPAAGQATPGRQARKTGQVLHPNHATAVLNLRDYGAVGDGQTNDAPALQQALDALASSGGGTLAVPAGHYLLQNPVLAQFQPGTEVTIAGEPSITSIDVAGNGSGLNLNSEFIIAVGDTNDAITLSGATVLWIRDLGFLGVQEVTTDARVVLSLADIGHVTIHHSEFYGLASLVAQGAIVAASNSDLTLEQSAFLGCAGNSGVSTPIVHATSWMGLTVTDCKFVDYGNRPEFYSKTPLAAPYSWISVGTAAAPTPNWSRREAIIRHVFLDEGAWIGIAARPDLFGPAYPDYEVYLSRLYVNVTNLGGTGAYVSGARKVFIEQPHFGWSHNAGAAINLDGVGEAILDLNECVLAADTILVDAERLAVINTTYTTLDSTAPFTRVITTDTPEEDPAQYVRQQYLDIARHDVDPAGHFYWTDQIVRCDGDETCVGKVQAALADYLRAAPEKFSLSGQVFDETGAPLGAVTVTLSGSQAVALETDANGNYSFTNLSTAGSYTLTPAKTHYTFASQLIVTPTSDQVRNFAGSIIPYEISGRVFKNTGQGLPGATLTLSGSQDASTTSDADGDFSFPNLAAGGDYVVTVARDNYVFATSSRSFADLSADQFIVFGGILQSYTIAGSLAKADGTPLSGALVKLSGGANTSLTTGADGKYSFVVHGDDNYTVTPSRPYYTFSPQSQTFSNLSAGESANFTGEPVEFVVSGQVTTSDGAYLSSVMLTVSGTETDVVATDQNHSYALELQAEGDYILTPSKPNYTFTPGSILVNHLVGNRTLNFTAFLNPGVPSLIVGVDPTRVVAIDSILGTTAPFKLLYDLPWAADRRTRLMVFATNFALQPGEGAANITATLEDAEHRIYPLTVEYADKVQGLGSLTRIVVRLSDDLTEDMGDVLIRLTYRGLTSEPRFVGIGSGSATNAGP